MEATAWGMFLASAKTCDIVSSAVDTVFPPGVFMTSTPLEVAAGTLMLSTPGGGGGCVRLLKSKS